MPRLNELLLYSMGRTYIPPDGNIHPAKSSLSFARGLGLGETRRRLAGHSARRWLQHCTTSSSLCAACRVVNDLGTAFGMANRKQIAIRLWGRRSVEHVSILAVHDWKSIATLRLLSGLRGQRHPVRPPAPELENPAY